MRVEPLDRALDLRQILLFLKELERPGVDRFEADVYVETAALPHEIEHLRIVHRLGADLGPPLRRHPLGDHPREQLFGASLVGGEDVIGEEDVACIPVDLQLVNHTVHRVGPERMAIHAGHGAEGARERAAPRGGDTDDASPLPAMDQIECRDWITV